MMHLLAVQWVISKGDDQLPWCITEVFLENVMIAEHGGRRPEYLFFPDIESYI
jgi:hypothetical protein